MKKILSLILLGAMLITALVACDGNGDGDENEADNNDASKGIDLRDYTIVRPDASTVYLVNYVITFKEEVLKISGVDLPVTNDDTAPKAKEIIIGDTTRAESASAMAELSDASDNEYIIKENGGKIVVLGKTEEATVRAMKIFLMNHVDASANKGYLKMDKDHSETGNVNLASMFLNGFTEFSTEYITDMSVPEKGSLVYYYPTMIKLAHNKDQNGTLIATHAGGWGDYNGYRIMRSTDNGNTWTEISRAVDKYTSIKNNQITKKDNSLQPCLFELPTDMGNYKEGTLFLGALTRGDNYRTGKSASALILYYSTDCGLTWSAYHTLASGGDAESKTGVWEPFFMYEEKTGRVYCFYSDETNTSGTKNGAGAQELVYKYTTDMKKWSNVKVAVTCQDRTNIRPGMISIAKMGNGKYYMTYEMIGLGGQIYAKTTDNLDDWGDPADYGTVVKTVDGKTMASAPWCAWSPAGGECGTLVVSAHHMASGKSFSGRSDLFLSFDYGETFIAIENPITYTKDENDKCGYSPFLWFSEDGRTLYYMNSVTTDDTGKQDKVVFARIKIW